MLILHAPDLTITGYQTYPETTTAPHIVAPDAVANDLLHVIGYAKLVEIDGELRLPENLADIAMQRANELAAAEARTKRDGLLHQLDAIVSNPMRWISFSTEEQQALSAYRVALLNVPQQDGFPNVIQWPAMPVL